MQLLVLLLLVYAAAVADTTLADRLRLGTVVPDFTAMIAVFWLLVIAKRGSFLGAGVVGLVQDLLAPGRIGLGMASLLVIGYLAARLRARLACEHPLWLAAITAPAVTAIVLATALGHWALGEASLPVHELAARAVGIGGYTAGLSLPLFMVSGWIRESTLARQRRLPAR